MDDLYIDNLSGLEFEEYLFNLFKNLGYEVESTPASNDYGADLIISKNSERIVVQAKRYNSIVGVSAIQEIVGAKSYYKANKCMVVTNNYFTPNAIELAKANNVELWDRDELIKMAIMSVNPIYNTKITENIQDYKDGALLGINTPDELLLDAINLVIKEGQASISLLQRNLKIGYARAARIIDEMEERGIIGGYEGSKPRKVLVGPEIFNNPAYFSSSNKVKIQNPHKISYLNPFTFNNRKHIKNIFLRLIIFPITFSYYLIKIFLSLVINFFIFVINSLTYLKNNSGS